MADSPPLLLTSGHSWLFACGAVVTCLVGSHSALQLAAASLRLARLTALSFSVQSVFSLHFVAMCGMQLEVPWGFDIGLTLISLLVIIIFGTAALSLTLFMRQKLEPQVLLLFPDHDLSPSFQPH